MEIFIIGITIQDKAIIIVKNMDISLRTALEHPSTETTIDGWVKLHALAIWRLAISASIVQQGQGHPIFSSTKEKEK